MKCGTSHQTNCNEYMIFNCHKICCEASACHLGNLIGNNVKADNVQNISGAYAIAQGFSAGRGKLL